MPVTEPKPLAVRADSTGAGSSGVPPSRRLTTGVASVTGSQPRYSAITPRHCCLARGASGLGSVTGITPPRLLPASR
jgi:hypothetical protein